MRDINVISGKYAFKTTKGHQLKKQKRGLETIENSARERCRIWRNQ
jgi:hypothetical protein